MVISAASRKSSSFKTSPIPSYAFVRPSTLPCGYLLRWLCYKEMATSAFLLWFCYEEGDGSNVVTFLYGGGFFFFSFVVAYGLVH